MVKNRQVPVDFWLGATFFGLLLWMSWYYFFERVGFQDSASYVIEMLKKDNFATVHGRIGALFSQLIPFALLKLKAPLYAVMVGYSLNFILVYFGCWLYTN